MSRSGAEPSGIVGIPPRVGICGNVDLTLVFRPEDQDMQFLSYSTKGSHFHSKQVVKAT